MAAPIIGAVGAGIKAVGSIKAGNAKKRQAERQAALQDQQAEETINRAETNVLALKRQREGLKGAQRSGFAKGGVELSGSALEVLEDTNTQFDRDVVNTRRQAQFDADQIRRGAQITRAEGKAAKTAGILGAVGAGAGAIGGFVKTGVSKKKFKPGVELGTPKVSLVGGGSSPRPSFSRGRNKGSRG